jgi:hypothetical protein
MVVDDVISIYLPTNYISDSEGSGGSCSFTQDEDLLNIGAQQDTENLG